MTGPRRIACLTEETTETLYLLGEEDRIVGISAFTVRPERARREKPVVSQFIKADIEKIVGVRPDLVLAFSDLQADIVAELVRRGLDVHVFNHRDVAGILAMIRMLGGMIGVSAKAEDLASRFETRLDDARRAAAKLSRRPRVFFEEWPDPIITGIGWVSELIEIAGGIDCFAENRSASLAKDRTVSPEEVLARKPDLYLASWCGKKFRESEARARPGFDDASFLRPGRFFEIPSAEILQPGPAALTDGLDRLREVITRFASESATAQ